jgi:hypothetical protein
MRLALSALFDALGGSVLKAALVMQEYGVKYDIWTTFLGFNTRPTVSGTLVNGLRRKEFKRVPIVALVATAGKEIDG